MSLPVVFLPAARTEFDAATNWYENRQLGRGMELIANVRHVLNRIATQPEFYPQVYRQIREALVPSYPYCVYYREESGRVLVLSIFHTARDPSVWQARTE